MRTSVLSLGAAVFLTLVECTGTGGGGGTSTGGTTASASGGAGGTGGTTANTSGGATNSGGTTANTSGGTTSSGGTTASGGTTSSGGTNATGGSTQTTGGTTATGGTASAAGGSGATGGSSTGGTTSTGGTVSTGGQPATGGTTSGGGMTSTGGSTAAAGTTASGGTSGSGGAATAYQGPCDLVSGGCAEAYSVTRAMTASYTGPLFQLGIAADKTAKTIDIAQTAAHTADMSTWNAYCSGTQSKCVISRIYAQVHTGANDLLPAIWNAPWGPDCSAGGYTCASKFTIEDATGLPILTTVTPQEYALSGDNFAMGVTGGSKAIGLMYNGKPVANNHYCCGVFGITHKYNANDTFGTDFMLALAYGWKDSNGCCIAVNCGASDKYCVGAEEEENNDLYDYGSSPADNAIVVTQFDPTANAVVTFMNGSQVLSHSPPKAQINAGTAVHLGGGGDLSGPDPVLMREAFITNALLTASEVTALKANAVAFYPMLKFP
ncbi:MAG TPA: arabinofuranosidase catalytic domain-containing protein [Polyangiaceae bacterium]|nr:arabinofuranosidase catalytic domain-containing protein [Polyangiaceae bacterium]